MKLILKKTVKIIVENYDNKINNKIFFIEVNPKLVRYIKLFQSDDIPVLGDNAKCGIVNGFWDMFKIPYERHPYYKSISERIKYNVKWEHSSMHKIVSATRDHTSLENYYSRLDGLIENIQSNGFKSQYQLGNTEVNKDWLRVKNIHVPPEIIVGMDRKGRLLQLANGRRRLAIAQLLNVKEIPAILTVYHSKAIDKLPVKRREITADSKDFMPII